jgi:hypothetical protein
MLDDLELPQVQEAALAERRKLVEHRADGLDGGVLQDLGRVPARFSVSGIAAGPEAAEFIDRLAALFRDGRPVPFTADVGAGPRIDQVVVAGLRVDELAGRPERWRYLLDLAEYQEPTEPEPAVDAAVVDEARGLVDGMAAALDLAPLFVSGLEPFVGEMEGLLGRVRQANGAAA